MQERGFDKSFDSVIIDLQREPEDGTGSRHPSLGDAGSVTPPDSQTEKAVAEMQRPFAMCF